MGPRDVSPKYLIINFLRPFSFSPKKKGQKERRRSARGRSFRESPHRHKWKLGALRALEAYQCIVAGGIRTEKPPAPPPDGHDVYRDGVLYVFEILPPVQIRISLRGNV
jgi:hypothetical protein